MLKTAMNDDTRNVKRCPSAVACNDFRSAVMAGDGEARGKYFKHEISKALRLEARAQGKDSERTGCYLERIEDNHYKARINYWKDGSLRHLIINDEGLGRIITRLNSDCLVEHKIPYDSFVTKLEIEQRHLPVQGNGRG